MIFDLLFRILTALPRELISHIPQFQIGDIPLPDNFSDTLGAMVNTTKYFFPLELLSFIMNTMFTLRVFRITHTIESQGWKMIKP